MIETHELRAMAHHVIVSEPARLVLFTIPKAGCTQLLKLVRRIDRRADWTDDPHHKGDLIRLSQIGVDRANEIMLDESWRKAVVLRDPVERLLSAYLHKFIHADSYAADAFRPGGKGMPFDEFVGYVLDPNVDPDRAVGLHPGTDPHWRPQHLVGQVGLCEPALDAVGDFDHIAAWIRTVLRRCGVWEEFGAQGWGSDDSAIFEANTYGARTGASDRMGEFYGPSTLRAVYDAYAADVALAARSGIDLVKHRELLV